MVFGVLEAESLGGGGFGVFVVEAGGEEGGVVAEEFFVEDPVGGVFADVDVDEGIGEESVKKGGKCQYMGDGGCGGIEWGKGELTHGEASRFCFGLTFSMKR